MSDILIEFEDKDRDHFAPLLAELQADALEVEATRFDGASIVQVLTAISGVTIPVIGKIVVESIRSKRHIKLKRKGVEITGLDPDGIIAVLREIERLNEQERRGAAPKRRPTRS